MKLFETTTGRSGIPQDFEPFEDEEFTIKRQKGILLELAGVQGAKQLQVTYRDFIFQMTKVEDAEARGLQPADLCMLYYDGVRNFAKTQAEPTLGTYRVANRLWYALDFVSEAKGKRMGNAVFATSYSTVHGNKVFALMLNWDMKAFSLGKEYVDNVLGSFSPRIGKASLRDGDAILLGALTAVQQPSLNVVEELLFELANAGKTKLELEFDVLLLLDGAPVFTSKNQACEPFSSLESGTVNAVRIMLHTPELPNGAYELVLAVRKKGGAVLLESRMPILFNEPSVK